MADSGLAIQSINTPPPPLISQVGLSMQSSSQASLSNDENPYLNLPWHSYSKHILLVINQNSSVNASGKLKRQSSHHL